MARTRLVAADPLARFAHRAVVPSGLRWMGPWLPKLAIRWQELKAALPPLKIRWGWALLVAVSIVLVMGECGPAASAIASLP